MLNVQIFIRRLDLLLNMYLIYYYIDINYKKLSHL